jgi:hypothetical protein
MRLHANIFSEPCWRSDNDASLPTAALTQRQPLRTLAVFLLFALVNLTVAMFFGVSFYL